MTTSYNLFSRNFQRDLNIKDWPKPTINFEFNWPNSVLDNSTGWNHHICVRSRFNVWLNIQLPHGCLLEPIHIVHFVPSRCMKLEDAWLYSLEYPHLNPACLEAACYIFYFQIVVSIEFLWTYKYCVCFPLSWCDTLGWLTVLIGTHAYESSPPGSGLQQHRHLANIQGDPRKETQTSTAHLRQYLLEFQEKIQNETSIPSSLLQILL